MAGWTTDSTTRDEIAAALALSADQITELNALADALGTGTRTLEVKYSASGSDWSNPTFYDAAQTVFRASLTGANVVLAGKMKPGKVTSQSIATATSLVAGSTILRVFNGSGRYGQMLLALGGSTGPRVPRSPAGLFAMVFGPDFGFAADPSLAVAPDKELTTLALKNTSGATQTAGFVTPSFGHAFVQGEIPVGSYPFFRTAAGVNIPATIWGENAWPDGSMQFCCVMLQVPVAIAAGASLTVQVRSGGVKPSAGTRTLAEASALGIQIDLNVTTPAEGAYLSNLASAITRAADLKVVADGPAGKIWRVGDHARNGSDVEHGQLYVRHFLYALSKADGSLDGFRHLARVVQPFATGNVPEARVRTLTCTVKAGAATVRALQGHDTTETPGSNISVPHYGSFMTAGPAARYDRFNAAGAVATDAPIQVIHDLLYAQRANFVPPSITGGSAQSLDYSYYAMGAGGMRRYMPDTGGRHDIGLVTGWCADYINNQSTVNEKALRVNAMCASGWRIALWQRDTVNITAVSDTRASFAGLGTIQKTWRYHDTGGGFQKPAPNTSLWTEDWSHRPNVFLMSYFLTGEPHLLDLIGDNAAAILAGLAPGLKTMDTARPASSPGIQPWVGDRDVRTGLTGTTFKNGGTAYVPGRTGAWATRDVALASRLLPDVMYDGSEANLYFRDSTQSSVRALAAYAENMPEPHRTDGLFIFEPNGGTDREYEAPWQTSFWNHVLCWMSGDNVHPETVTARKYMLRRYRRAIDLFDIGVMISYRAAQYDENENMILSMQQYVANGKRRLQLDSETNIVTILPRGADEMGNWTPTAGDIVAFSEQLDAVNIPFPEHGRNKRLYVINPVGQTFQLSLTKGGSVLDIPTSMTVTHPLGQYQNLAPATMFSEDVPYNQMLIGALKYHQRMGDTDATAVRDVYQPKYVALGRDVNVVSPFNFKDS